MAYRDYILCKTCGCKIVYDGDDNGRNMLETYWGKPFAPDWTVGLLCPDCIAQMEAECEALRAALQGIVDFADAPVECKRPDVFALRINKSRAALKEVSDADA